MKRIALLTPLCLIIGACSAPEQPPGEAPKVLTLNASRADGRQEIYTGEIRARHEFDLAFRVGGKIASRLVDAGSRVKAGQPLARLDPADLELASSASRAQLHAAESEAHTAQAERERYADLLAKKFVSQAAFDAKENAAKTAQARLRQAQAQSTLSGNQAAYGTLTVDRDAVVVAVLADAGQVVAAGQALFRMAREEEKEVQIAIPESRIADWKIGQAVRVAPWSKPEEIIHGEVREIAPVADPASRTFNARIRLPQAPETLKLGMTARVQTTRPGNSPLRLPLGAVINRGQGAEVWVVSEGKAQVKPVHVLRYQEDGVDIDDGISEGEVVIVAGSQRLQAGQAVRSQALTPPERQR